MAGPATILYDDVPTKRTQAVSQTYPLPVEVMTSSTVDSTNVTSTTYEASHILKATPGVLFGVIGYNSKTTAQFIQLHDSATLPADTAVPVVTISVPGSTAFSIDYGSVGRGFANGIIICNSSTGNTKTIGSADCFFDAQVV